MLTKHNVPHKAAQILITEDTDYNRNLLSDLWGDIAKCVQRAANKTIPSIIVNKDQSINSHNHSHIRKLRNNRSKQISIIAIKRSMEERGNLLLHYLTEIREQS